MAYVVINGVAVEPVPFEGGLGFQSVMHLPMVISPHCSIQGTSVAVIEAQAQGTHQNSLPEGIQPWQELPK